MSNKQMRDEETQRIIQELEGVVGLPGDVVEFGCYRGETSVLLAEALSNTPDKWLWLYDSFEGLPQKQKEDVSATGTLFRAGALKASKDAVLREFRKRRLPEPAIRKGWFEDLRAEDLPEAICFALLDGDFYSSIASSLQLVAPKIVYGGIIMVHDYKNPALPGSSRAVMDFYRNNRDLFRLTVASGMARLERLSP
ncbi:class I SAM-dependent methyltransferase [Candidatus Saccharibacteria bacterium]|nr:class I SAM-dependent methyltransferase [Candidatus Saccharibacteria bacterium]